MPGRPEAYAMLAHAGHWAVDIATYLVPLVVVVVALKLGDRRQRRRHAEADQPEAGAEPR